MRSGAAARKLAPTPRLSADKERGLALGIKVRGGALFDGYGMTEEQP
jgi:hypothetical protein